MQDAHVQRFCSYLGALTRESTAGELGQYPGLSSQAFHLKDCFPLVEALESNFSAIRKELLNIVPTEFHTQAEMLERHGSWDVFHFFERGRKNEQNGDLCPVTMRVIEQHATVRTLAGLAYASRMTPGTHVSAHCGPTNLRLRCHMGIQVPGGDCALRVGGQVRGWEEGKCLVFDDSLEHEAWNHTEDTRLVLIVDVWHPDLSSVEIELLEGLHRYSEVQAQNLARYWIANDRARIQQRVKSYLKEGNNVS